MLSSGVGLDNPPSVEQDGLAPRYEIPTNPVANIEHPCIIKNVDRGILSLGGNKQIEKVDFDIFLLTKNVF